MHSSRNNTKAKEKRRIVFYIALVISYTTIATDESRTYPGIKLRKRLYIL